jgi:hypothetical protein
MQSGYRYFGTRPRRAPSIGARRERWTFLRKSPLHRDQNRGEIKKRFCRLNRDGWYLSILDSQRGADQKEIPDSRLKSPQKAYRIYKTKRVTSDGEVVPCLRQKKSKLRKGERITLFHLMKGLYLDELAAAGGEGADITRRVKRAAERARGFRN